MNTASFFPADLLMDFAMLATAQLCLSGFCLGRLLAAQLVMSAATLLCLHAGFARVLHAPVFILCAAIATGARRPGRILEAAAAMLCASAALAGFSMLGRAYIMPAAGCALFIFLLRRHRHMHCKWNIEVQIEKNGCTVSLPALIDTGNRLREHASGLPVLIVEADAMPELAEAMQHMRADEIRILPYGVLGSSGEIPCFRPDSIHMLLPGTGALQAPPCWVAVFPGHIPGRTCALAPPEFAEAAEDRSDLIYRFRERARRVLLWRFQM